jgi:hypothetical protein
MTGFETSDQAGYVKGSILAPFLHWYRSERGSPELAALVRVMGLGGAVTLDPDRRDLGINVRRWYPATAVHRAMDHMCAGLCPEEVEGLAERAAAGVIDIIQRGVYRTMFRFAFTPSRYARDIQRMWDRLYDNGRVSVEHLGVTCQRIQVDEWRAHHPLLCRVQALSRAQNYRLMGCRNLQLERDACVSEGEPACVVTMRWSGWLPRLWRSG